MFYVNAEILCVCDVFCCLLVVLADMFFRPIVIVCLVSLWLRVYISKIVFFVFLSFIVCIVIAVPLQCKKARQNKVFCVSLSVVSESHQFPK